jgi:hypothetical protein
LALEAGVRVDWLDYARFAQKHIYGLDRSRHIQFLGFENLRNRHVVFTGQRRAEWEYRSPTV